MRAWSIACLCALFTGIWLCYYFRDEPVAPHDRKHIIYRSHITPYRNLPASVQKKICCHAQQAERLFFPDAQYYRLAILRTLVSGGYHQRI